MKKLLFLCSICLLFITGNAFTDGYGTANSSSRIIKTAITDFRAINSINDIESLRGVSIQRFKVTRQPKNGDAAETVSNEGVLFNEAVKTLLEKAALKDIYRFEDIEVTMPDNTTQTISSVSIMVLP